MTLSDPDLAAILRGDAPTGDDYRQALGEMRADGFVLVHRGVLGEIAAGGPADRTLARHLALVALLSVDVDLLTESLVTSVWGNRLERKAVA